MGRKQTKYLNLLLIVSLFLSTCIHFNSDLQKTNTVSLGAINNYPKSAWVNSSITIDDDASTNTTNSGNWNWAKEQPWCTGNGIEVDPYIISNLTLNPTITDNGLNILNSDNVYFNVTNVNVTGSLSHNNIGINLENINYYTAYSVGTNYGTIENCIIDQCRRPFIMDECEYLVIQNNIFNQSLSGAILDINGLCNRISIHNNSFLNAMDKGIDLGYDCIRIFIANNTFIDCKSSISARGNLIDIIGNDISASSENSNRDVGISVYGGQNIEIAGNEISNMKSGITISTSTYVSIENNTITTIFDLNRDLFPPFGIYILDAQNSTISNNSLVNLGFYFHSILAYLETLNVTDDNYVNGKRFYFFVNIHNQIIQNTANPGQLFFAYCENVSISGVSISNTTYGICIMDSTDFLIENSQISNCGIGVFMSSVNTNDLHNMTLKNNVISNCDYGIQLHYSNNSQICSNNLSMNNIGMFLFYSNELNISDNCIIENNYDAESKGIYLMTCMNNTIADNTLLENSIAVYGFDIQSTEIVSNRVSQNVIGIELVQDSIYNLIHDNSVYDNEEYGVLIDGSPHNRLDTNLVYSSGTGILIKDSNFTTIHANHILDNEIVGVAINDSACQFTVSYKNIFELNAINAIGWGTNSFWSHNYIGNYWDDHNGVDADADGICENPYSIATNGTDNYPINRTDIDFDGDGLPLLWEITNGLNSSTNDSTEDPDNDALSNLEEYENGTDPNDEDSDGDGHTDGEEVSEGTDPLDSEDFPLSDPTAPPIPEMFTKWWFYSIIGVIVLAVVSAVIITRRKNSSGKIRRKRNPEPQI